MVDGPQTDGRWGNTVAGPVFNAIAVEAARYLGIVPDVPSGQSLTNPKRHIQPPSLLYANAVGTEHQNIICFVKIHNKI